MEKFASFRIQKLENHKAKNALNHNIRKGWQPKYIDTSRSYKNYTIEGSRDLDLEAIKKEQQKRSKRKIQKNSTRFLSGIMTFSNSMSKDYDREIFDDCSKDFIKKIKDHLGLTILQAEVHLDETTPHIHLIFDNLDKNGKTINRTITPEKLSQAQDLIGESFEEMGYRRGIDKNETNAKHLTISDYQKLKAEEEQLSKDNKTLIKLFNDLMNTKPLTEEQKDLLSDLAPSLFQFVDKDDRKKKAKLSEKISKALKM